MSLAAIILSGGASTRMGAPKALLRVPGGGETFLDHLIGVLGAQASPVIVVLGHETQRILEGVARSAEALFVTNTKYQEGQLSSLQCGLTAVPRDAAGFLFTPVDIPLVRPETVNALARAFEREAGRTLVTVPRCEGRRGHPVCCARELIPEFLALPAEGQARDVIRRHASRTCYVDVNDPGILRDIDDLASYLSLPGLAGSQ